MLFETVEGAAAGAGAWGTCTTSAAKQQTMTGDKSSIEQKDLWVCTLRGCESACERDFQDVVCLDGCARQWGCSCAAWIAWREHESNVRRTAVQSVVVDADVIKRITAFHTCFMQTDSVHHDILC